MNAFEAKMNGTLYGVMQWTDWDALRERLLGVADARWYAYAVGVAAPEAPLPVDALAAFLEEIDALLRREHEEDYLGIVYADDLSAPSLVKIYDPNQLGSACGGMGTTRTAPGWVLSLDRPSAIETSTPLPGNRRRWWSGLLARVMAPN